MKEKRCHFCGSDRHEERKLDYLYQYKGDYLLVPNTPVEVCLECGMVYYAANVLKEIERHFFAIQANTEQPDRSIDLIGNNLDSPIQTEHNGECILNCL